MSTNVQPVFDISTISKTRYTFVDWGSSFLCLGTWLEVVCSGAAWQLCPCRLYVFSLEPDAEITSRRCYVVCTGLRSGGGSTSSWRALFICYWPDKLLITSPRIFTSLLQVQVASCVPLRTGRAVSHARTARLATEALPQQGLECGTVCHRIYATKN